MPKDVINGVELYWELSGQSDSTIALIHGAWVDHNNWGEFVPYLNQNFRVLSYDRRGHSQSERLAKQSTMKDNIVDLVALLNHLNLAPVHLLGNSYGAMIALRMAADHPEICLSVGAHEPPFLHLNETVKKNKYVAEMDQLQREVVKQLIAGEMESSISRFLNAVVRPNVWDDMPEDFRQFLVSQAPTFIDDVNDPNPWTTDLEQLAKFPNPILFTQGEHSAKFYGVILDEIHKAIPQAERIVIQDVDHDPHVSRPQEYAEIIISFISKNA
jgi:pimeloyl-ACP methyl ester carboxylesterase